MNNLNIIASPKRAGYLVNKSEDEYNHEITSGEVLTVRTHH